MTSFNTTLFDNLRNDPFLVGFDQLFDRLVSSGAGTVRGAAYPPYNIVKKGKDNFAIEVALAGFDESEIEVTVKDDTLTIESLKDHSASGGGDQILHQGIAERNFKRAWTLSPTVKVAGASFVNGFLSVNLVNEVPEEKKPRVIELNSDAVAGDPAFLSE
jgi:molecular chaperone IbpA